MLWDDGFTLVPLCLYLQKRQVEKRNEGQEGEEAPVKQLTVHLSGANV